MNTTRETTGSDEPDGDWQRIHALPAIAIEDDAGGLLLAPINGHTVDVTRPLYRVDTTGRRIWQTLAQPQSPATLVAQLASDHEVPAQTLHADIAAFLDDLQRHRLIRRTTRGPADSAVPDSPIEPPVTPADGLTHDPDRLGHAILIRLIRAVLDRNASLRLRVNGMSMQPFLRDGDTLTIAACDPAGLRLGDIVAFTTGETPDRLVIHRIIQRPRPGHALICRGDNAVANDTAVPDNQILGRIVHAQRNDRVLRLGWGWERQWIARLSRTGRLRRLWRLLAGGTA